MSSLGWAATRPRSYTHERFDRLADLVGGDKALLDLLSPVRAARVREICMTPARELFGATAVEPAFDRAEQSLRQAVLAPAFARIDPGEAVELLMRVARGPVRLRACG